MPRTARKTESRATDRGSTSRVWRFVDYEGRFAPSGMPNGLEVAQYAKWYLNGWQGPGGEWLVALNRLRAEKEFIWYQGAVVELLTAAMNQSSEYQGYLVTGRKVPMEASDVGSMLRVEGRKAHVVLTRLEQVGILERVDWPMPDGDSDGDISDDHSLRLLQNVAEASKRTRRKGGPNRRFRNENEGPPLNKVEKVERSAAQTTVEGTNARTGGTGRAEAPAATAAGKTAKAGQVVCPQCGHTGQVPKLPKGTKALQCTVCNHATPIPKTSTPSTSPDGCGAGPDSDGQSHRESGRKAGSAPSIIRLGDQLAVQGHRYSAEANAFGEQVIAAMGQSYADRGEYVNEVAHWAKLWESCRTLTDSAAEKVKAKVMRVAGQIRSGHIRPQNPQGYLQRTGQNEIRDARRAHKVQAG